MKQPFETEVRPGFLVQHRHDGNVSVGCVCGPAREPAHRGMTICADPFAEHIILSLTTRDMSVTRNWRTPLTILCAGGCG